MPRKTNSRKAASSRANDNPNPILELDLTKETIYYANPSTFESFSDLQRLGFRHPFLARALEVARPLLEGKTKSVREEIDVGKSCYAVTIVRIPKTERVCVYSVDITERKQAENAVRESEQRVRMIVQQANAGIARYNVNDGIEFANERFCKMLGYPESELIGKNIREITHPEDVAKTMRAFERVLKKGKSTEIEKRYIRKDGSVVWVNVSDAPERGAAGRGKSVVAVAVDITARKKAEAALERSKKLLEKLVDQRTKALRAANAELESEISRRRGLESEILEISDREQQRLGQELHDGLCQQLAAIGFMARATALRLKNHRVIEVKDIEKIARLITSSVMDARNIARDLHREEVDAAGFALALQDLVQRKIWKIPCRLEGKTEFNIDNDKVASQLYRILREALVNANKHARASQIMLEVRRTKNELVFSVTDDGVGLNAKTKSGRGLGFHIMNYRAQSIGARLELESPSQGGTRLAVYLPEGK